jgi:hypothetical protein
MYVLKHLLYFLNLGASNNKKYPKIIITFTYYILKIINIYVNIAPTSQTFWLRHRMYNSCQSNCVRLFGITVTGYPPNILITKLIF